MYGAAGAASGDQAADSSGESTGQGDSGDEDVVEGEFTEAG